MPNHLMTHHTLDASRLDDATRQALDLLERMIAIPSTSRDEQGVADCLERYMHEVSGLPVHRYGHNLWLIDPRYDAARPTVLLNAHIDTVKPAASWRHDPFTPTMEDTVLADGTIEQRLYGLGANDDGASVVSLLHTFVLLTLDAGQPTAGDAPGRPNFVFLASAEEEVSGKGGIESVLPLLPHIDVALVGEPTGMQPAVAEKGLVVIDGVAHGKAGHAARNEGVNALYIALDAIQRLRDYRFERVSETLGPVKVTVTGIQCGTTHNVVPDQCTLMVDCRTTDAYTNEQVVATLREQIADLDCELTPRSTRLQPSGIDLEHPLMKRILAHGRQPFGSPTLSDQALLRCPSVKMGPGQSSRSHTADEYIRPDEIRESISLYYSILSGLKL